MEIALFAGDIADAPAEAVCTSTNPRLSLMMGTGAAVRERGGFAILRECEAIRGNRDLPAGSVHVTSAGRLPFRAAIHCVASDSSHRSSPAIIRSCIEKALARADELGIRSLAMPLFGHGHARIRLAQSLTTIVETLRAARTEVERVVIVIYDAENMAEARQVLGQLAPV